MHIAGSTLIDTYDQTSFLLESIGPSLIAIIKSKRAAWRLSVDVFVATTFMIPKR